MTEKDPAFLWETEALRASPRRSTTPAAAPPPTSGWVTLNEAYLATGIPTGTLRKWARRDHVPSRVVDTPRGERRLVDMSAVIARAATLGREIAPVEASETGVVASFGEVGAGEVRTAEAAKEVVEAGAVDSGEVMAEGVGSAEAAVEVVDTGEAVAAPSGTMIVPIDAWEKMLLQLGNLHEAGQQLAEARERAAKAETEARFLRERLAEMRVGTRGMRPESADAGQSASPPAPSTTAPPPADDPGRTRSSGYVSGGEAWTPPPVMATWWQYAQRRWTQRRRRR